MSGERRRGGREQRWLTFGGSFEVVELLEQHNHRADHARAAASPRGANVQIATPGMRVSSHHVFEPPAVQLSLKVSLIPSLHDCMRLRQQGKGEDEGEGEG